MSVFEAAKSERLIADEEHFFVIWDGYPASPGHCLVVSQRVVPTYFELSEEERLALGPMILRAKEAIEKKHRPSGYNIGMNCGASAGQTVNHFHCHVIPRYDGDMPDPRGGVRHCVAGKGNY